VLQTRLSVFPAQARRAAGARARCVQGTIFYHFCSCDWLNLPTQRLNEIPATLREPQGDDEAPEKLEAERQVAQDFIDTGVFRHDLQKVMYVG
jgi:hypothetical protein